MKKVETILVGGMMQSGSHLIFNLVRILLEELGCGVKVYTSGAFQGYLKEATNNNRTFILDREHFFGSTPYYSHPKMRISNATELDFCVLSYRDPRDTASSWSLKNEVKSHAAILERAGENIQVFESYNGLDSNKLLRWKYEDYKRALMEENKENLYELFRKLVSFLSLQNECNNIKQPFNLLIDKIIFEAETEIDRSAPLPARRRGSQDISDHWKKTNLVPTVRSSNKGKVGGFKDHLHPELIGVIESSHGDWLKEHGYLE